MYCIYFKDISNSLSVVLISIYYLIKLKIYISIIYHSIQSSKELQISLISFIYLSLYRILTLPYEVVFNPFYLFCICFYLMNYNEQRYIYVLIGHRHIIPSNSQYSSFDLYPYPYRYVSKSNHELTAL